MSSNVLIKFDAVPGESIQAGFEEWIEVRSFSFQVSTPVNIAGQGLGSGKANLGAYTVQTEMGAHSAALLKKVLEGKHHPSIDIRVLKNIGEDKLAPYFTIDGKKGYIESLSWSAGEDGHMYENITFHLEEHVWEYHQQDTESGQLAAKGKMTYNVQTGLTA
jgi:type VI secretion system Hcp family effector